MNDHQLIKGHQVDHKIYKQSNESAEGEDIISIKLFLKPNHKDPIRIKRGQSFEKKTKIIRKKYQIDPEKKKLVEEFANHYHLQIVRFNEDLGIVSIKGKISDIEQAFKVEMKYHYPTDRTFNKKLRGHYPAGDIFIPKKIHHIVESVVGLRKYPHVHQTPIQDLHLIGEPCYAAATGVSSKWFCDHYNFPEQLNGKGQHMAIIGCGGGFNQDDIDHYLKEAGLTAHHEVQSICLDGMSNDPGDWAFDYELHTDILISQSAAPGAKLTVYLTENSLQGFSDAVELISLTDDGPKIISYSWAASEDTYSKKEVAGVERILQYATEVCDITIVVCSGDKGSTNDEDSKSDTELVCTYPATSAFVTSCGGTMFKNLKKERLKETVWQSVFLYDLKIHNGSGGGFSNYIKRPKFQKNAIDNDMYPDTHSDFRGVPDVAAYADVAPGGIAYWIYFNGKDWLTGGTSSSTPLWAALIARLNQGLGQPIGYFNPLLYQMNSKCVKSINHGSNSMPDGPDFWHATDGWDPCTGLGIPDGTKMLAWLKENL